MISIYANIFFLYAHACHVMYIKSAMSILINSCLYSICSKFWHAWTNSVDPDQTAPFGSESTLSFSQYTSDTLPVSSFQSNGCSTFLIRIPRESRFFPLSPAPTSSHSEKGGKYFHVKFKVISLGDVFIKHLLAGCNTNITCTHLQDTVNPLYRHSLQQQNNLKW